MGVVLIKVFWLKKLAKEMHFVIHSAIHWLPHTKNAPP